MPPPSSPPLDLPSRRQLQQAPPETRAVLLDALATHAANGEADAASDLAWAILHFELARPALRRYLIGDADLQAAEQATLIAVAFRIGSWRGEGRFTSWLHQVATNEARQLIRSEARHRVAAPSDDDLAPGLVRRLSSMITTEQAVRDAVGALPPAHRQVLELREFAGLTYNEIADRLGLPLNTVKTHLHRARAELAERLLADYRD